MDWIKGYYFQVKHELHHRVNLTLYTNQHQDEIPYLIQLRKFIKVNWFAQLIYSEFSKKISFLKAFETDTVHFVKLSTITKTRAVHGSFTAECWRRMMMFGRSFCCILHPVDPRTFCMKNFVNVSSTRIPTEMMNKVL